MPLFDKLLINTILIFVTTVARAQNIISTCEVQTYLRFVRITLAMTQPPVFTTSIQPGLRAVIEGEVQFDFANTRLAANYSAPVDPSLQIRLTPMAPSGEVKLCITPKHAFTFNAFYFTPRKVFIIDVLPQGGIVQKARARNLTEEGIASLARGDTAAALSAFQQLIAHSPTEVVANYYIGLIRMHRGDLEMAKQNFRRAASSGSAFADSSSEQLAKIAQYLRIDSPSQVAKWHRWIRDNKSRFWRLSLVFAVLGIFLMARHMLTAKSVRAVKKNAEPPKFSSLFAQNIARSEVRLADLEENSHLEETQLSADAVAHSYSTSLALPAPLFEGTKGWPEVIAKISKRNLPEEQPAAIARSLEVGQGEVELHLYMQKRQAAVQPMDASQLRLTFVEG